MNNALIERLREVQAIQESETALRILPILAYPTGTTSKGFAFLEQEAWERFRDTVPHVLCAGNAVRKTIDTFREVLAEMTDLEDEKDHAIRALKVMERVVNTAAITAPPDLWLLRHVLGFFNSLGLTERLLAGDAIYPNACVVDTDEGPVTLDPLELDKDCRFLLSRAVLEQYETSYRLAGHPRARRILENASSLGPNPPRMTNLWARLFANEPLSDADLEALLDIRLTMQVPEHEYPNHWMPTLEEIALGWRLVPVVLALRANGLTRGLKAGESLGASSWATQHPNCAQGALEILKAAGWLERAGEEYVVTAVGSRGFGRGPGPFGIIETYHPYMARGAEILCKDRGEVWVARGENVGASQDANAGTFKTANNALDRFCEDTGFSYHVFIEHAIGRGEATRQRLERSGEETIRYFGADLEDAAIDAAVEQQARGALPSNMGFVRQADIGSPEVLLDALREAGVDPRGAVMLVGNGFHEVRQQSDEGMVEVFRKYGDAGVILLFTEENALSIDDLRATAWNTYHAGFKYVHEKSGQGLRPADARPPVRLGLPLRAPWSVCAGDAGYIRADAYCSRTRTIYPFTPESGVNPSISENHFFVPRPIAEKLGLSANTSAAA